MKSIKGHRVYRDLRNQVDDARRVAAESRVRVDRLGREIRELTGARAETVGRLAAHFLPEMTAASVAATLEEMRAPLRELLEDREERVQELTAGLAANREQDDAADAAREDAGRALALRREALAELEAEAVARLQADPRFAALSEAAARAEARLTQNEARAAEVHQEAREKLPAYERSALFQYLHRRGFETTAYRARGLFRRLDRRLARFIDYRTARVGYDFLRTTPPLVDAELERRRAEFDALMDRVEAERDAVAEAVGIPPVAAEVEQLEAQHDAIARDIEALHATAVELTDELRRIEAHRGQFYAAALAQMREFLSGTRTARLEAHAASTPDRTDDNLVDALEDADARLAALSRELEGAREAADTLEARHRELDAMLSKFRQRGFHRDRSEFRGYDPRSDFDAFSHGRIDADDIWGKVTRHHRTRPEPQRSGLDVAADVITHPATRVLLDVMGHVVSGALRGSAGRSVGRRSGGLGSIFGGGGSFGGGSSRGGSSGFRIGKSI